MMFIFVDLYLSLLIAVLQIGRIEMEFPLRECDLSDWPAHIRPDWFQIVIERATCEQGCKTVEQAIIWENEARNLIQMDQYAVCRLLMCMV
jgi:hypothetical protein